MRLLKCVVVIIGLGLLAVRCERQPEQQPGVESAVPGKVQPGAKGKIAFTSYSSGQNDIHVINDDGTGETNLTNSPDLFEENPRWSPNGTRIAFERNKRWPDDPEDICVMDADGKNCKRLTNSPEREFDPNWFPDGTRITFTFNRGSIWETHVINADGSGERQTTAWDYNPSWSPDGTKIAFASHRDAGSQIYVMDSDGTNARRLTKGQRLNGHPSWSPDGTRILFTSEHRGRSDIWVVNVDGTGEVCLTPGGARGSSLSPSQPAATPAMWLTQPDLTHDMQPPRVDLLPVMLFIGTGDYNPCWSPDGSKIAFTSNRDSNYEIYVMNSDGTNQINLTNNPAGDGSLAWSPDGRKIAFVSTRDGNDEIYVMNSDGSNQTRLTNNPARDWSPSWSPF